MSNEMVEAKLMGGDILRTRLRAQRCDKAYSDDTRVHHIYTSCYSNYGKISSELHNLFHLCIDDVQMIRVLLLR